MSMFPFTDRATHLGVALFLTHSHMGVSQKGLVSHLGFPYGFPIWFGFLVQWLGERLEF